MIRSSLTAAQHGKVFLHIDPDVLEGFEAQGEDHVTRMRAVLRFYVEAQKQRR